MNTSKGNQQVKLLREKLGLTQKEFAEKTGISANTISNIETTDIEMRIDTAKLIARAFGVSLDWLYGLSETESTNLLDSFCSFFSLGQQKFEVENSSTLYAETYLTIRLSKVVKDYLLEVAEIERINKEKDLPVAAYKAWLSSVRDTYQKALDKNESIYFNEYVLIENDEQLGSDIAYTRMRRSLPDISAKIALDKINFDSDNNTNCEPG